MTDLRTPETPTTNTDPAVVILKSTKKYKLGQVFQTDEAKSLIGNNQARLATPRDAAIAGKTFPPEAFETPKNPPKPTPKK